VLCPLFLYGNKVALVVFNRLARLFCLFPKRVNRRAVEPHSRRAFSPGRGCGCLTPTTISRPPILATLPRRSPSPCGSSRDAQTRRGRLLGRDRSGARRAPPGSRPLRRHETPADWRRCGAINGPAVLMVGSARSLLIGFSAGQTFSRDREADGEAFWLPVPGDFAAKARNRGADEKFAEPVVTRWRYDFGSSALCPGNDEGLSENT
jgi:hypothetical protein